MCIKTLLEIQSEGLSGCPPIPFSDASCRKSLYSLLLNLISSPSPQWPPPTQCAMTVFSMGLRDKDASVSLLYILPTH